MTDKKKKFVPMWKKHERFDMNKATKGVVVKPVDPRGNEYGSWTVGHYDIHCKFFKVAAEKFTRTYDGDERSKGEMGDLFAWVQIFLHDWAGQLDADGNEEPFDKDVAFEVLSEGEDNWLATYLLSFSRDPDNFQPTASVTKEEDVKN
jgi:hypothetical protein